MSILITKKVVLADPSSTFSVIAGSSRQQIDKVTKRRWLTLKGLTMTYMLGGRAMAEPRAVT